jgi:threonine/homoserine/homoserine lactone efflux protein
MDTAALATFWVISFSLVLTPGADWAYAISAGMQGRALGSALLGMLLGYLMIVLLVAAGFGAFIASVPAALEILTIVGAGYLLWLGLGVLRRPPVPDVANEQTKNWTGWVIRGFGVTGTNPKVLLLFLALLPQFTNPAARLPVAEQIGILGLVHVANCVAVYPLVGLSAKFFLRSRPRLARTIGQCSGTAMICIALVLLVEQIRA